MQRGTAWVHLLLAGSVLQQGVLPAVAALRAVLYMLTSSISCCALRGGERLGFERTRYATSEATSLNSKVLVGGRKLCIYACGQNSPSSPAASAYHLPKDSQPCFTEH